VGAVSCLTATCLLLHSDTAFVPARRHYHRDASFTCAPFRYHTTDTPVLTLPHRHPRRLVPVVLFACLPAPHCLANLGRGFTLPLEGTTVRRSTNTTYPPAQPACHERTWAGATHGAWAQPLFAGLLPSCALVPTSPAARTTTFRSGVRCGGRTAHRRFMPTARRGRAKRAFFAHTTPFCVPPNANAKDLRRWATPALLALTRVPNNVPASTAVNISDGHGSCRVLECTTTCAAPVYDTPLPGHAHCRTYRHSRSHPHQRASPHNPHGALHVVPTAHHRLLTSRSLRTTPGLGWAKFGVYITSGLDIPVTLPLRLPWFCCARRLRLDSFRMLAGTSPSLNSLPDLSAASAAVRTFVLPGSGWATSVVGTLQRAVTLGCRNLYGCCSCTGKRTATFRRYHGSPCLCNLCLCQFYPHLLPLTPIQRDMDICWEVYTTSITA